MLTLLGAGQGQINATYDTDYLAVLNRGVALGYTLPTLFQRALQNKLVIDLKAAGVWAKLDVFYNFANNGSKEFATLNWKAPTLNQCTLINSITFNTNQGFTGNGTSTYVDTNFQLASGVNYTLNNASRCVYINTTSGNGVYDGNSLAATNTFKTGTSTAQRINQALLGISPAFVYNTNGGIDGFKSIHRTTGSLITLFNGTTSETRNQVSSSPLAATNHLLLRSTTSYAAHTISMFSAGASLVSENTAFATAYYNYMVSIFNTP